MRKPISEQRYGRPIRGGVRGAALDAEIRFRRLGIPAGVAVALAWGGGYDTAREVRRATDAALLSIYGVGPCTLKGIREYLPRDPDIIEPTALTAAAPFVYEEGLPGEMEAGPVEDVSEEAATHALLAPSEGGRPDWREWYRYRWGPRPTYVCANCEAPAPAPVTEYGNQRCKQCRKGRWKVVAYTWRGQTVSVPARTEPLGAVIAGLEHELLACQNRLLRADIQLGEWFGEMMSRLDPAIDPWDWNHPEHWRYWLVWNTSDLHRSWRKLWEARFGKRAAAAATRGIAAEPCPSPDVPVAGGEGKGT